MNIREVLLEAHSKPQTDKIVAYVGADPTKLKALINLSLSNEYRVVQRVAWPLSEIALKHPELLQPYLAQILEKSQESGVHVAVKRNVMRLFQYVALPESIHSPLLNAAFTYLSQPEEAVAVRVCAMTVMCRLTEYYPDLAQELRLLLEDVLANEQSAGLRSRAKKTLKYLQENR